MNSDNDLIVKKYNIHPLREGILFGVALLIVGFSSNYFILHHALNAEIQEIKEGMIRQAKILATLIDGDLHATFTSPLQETTSEYQQAIKPLSRALLESCDNRLDNFKQIFEVENGCSLIFIYTIIQRNNKVHYVLDPWPKGIMSPNNPELEMRSRIMEEYNEANETIIQALTTHKGMATNVYPDAWGQFISAYAPFYNKQGEFVGIVGIDMKAERYLNRLKPIKTAANRAFVAIFCIAYLVGSIIWFLRNFILVINTRRLVLKRYLDKTKEITTKAVISSNTNSNKGAKND